MDTATRLEGGLRLDPGRVLRLTGAAGRHLSVVEGSVWITQRGDHRDPVIEPGESFRFARNGLSLVQPLGGGAIVVLEDGLAPDVGDLGETISERARALRHEVPRLRAQAVAAMIGGVVGRIATLWRGVHALRDVGLRRDDIRRGGRSRSCLQC